MENILIIVESPNKVKTISQFLPPNYKVMASVGHISYIKDEGKFNMGIDPDNNFKTSYAVSPDKKEIVDKLKKQVEWADKVILASDPDREGEAISWHLKHFLKIPENKYERVTYHEITKKAIMEALNNPRKIDDNLVNAAKSRQKLDKIVGYRLSGIARNNVKAKSVGRCQSAGLKILVEREMEIRNFKPVTYYELFLHFNKNKNQYKAKYIGTDDNKCDKFNTLNELDTICEECKLNDFIVSSSEIKERNQSPKLPFTTSTFQQEVSNKLGISVKDAMSCAQRLFEGIDIDGEHIALITYIRTDSTEFAPEFVDELKSFVIDMYGKKYYADLRKAKKKENVQDGHEAIRPVDLSMTPEKLKNYINDSKLLKVYTIIYNRTVAASMADSILSETEYNIYNGKHKFTMVSRELIFDGYKRVYDYKDTNDEDEISLERFNIPEKLKKCELEQVQKVTKPPKRYSESSFIKTLDKLGIGRPSTYATIVNVLLDEKRGYCKVEDKLMIPTDLGISLSEFLDKSFGDIINLTYTAEMEKDLDLIANGKLKDVKFLTDFYNKLENSINKVDPNAGIEKKCPNCGSVLQIRRGKYGLFLGCPKYPECRHIEKLN